MLLRLLFLSSLAGCAGGSELPPAQTPITLEAQLNLELGSFTLTSAPELKP